MGSSIVLQVVRDLIPLGLENSTDLLLAGNFNALFKFP